jgi:hypothetical protein
MPTDLVHPTGTVALGSKLYVPRESDEAAKRVMGRLPGLVHILGPRQMGKSSLLTRLAHGARSDPDGPVVVSVNFQDFDTDTLSDLTALLIQLAMEILDAAGRNPELALEIKDSAFTAMSACRRLIQREVLARNTRGVLIALDETDRVVGPGSCAEDFYAMLRAWHEAGKQDPDWAGLRLALAFGTEALMVPEGTTHSPLENVGLKCYLRNFHEAEVAKLAGLHGIESADGISRSIMDQLGGNPYLTRRSLYALAEEGYDFDRVISEALSRKGPLGDHLARFLRLLESAQELARALQQILYSSKQPEERQYQRLEGLGLVRREGARVVPRYRLYRDFFREHL